MSGESPASGSSPASASPPGSLVGPAFGVEAGPALRAGGGLALGSRRAWIVLLLTIAVSLLVDLGSKSVAFERVALQPVQVQREQVLRVKREIDPRAISRELIPPHPARVVVPGLLHFTLVLNPGAVFGVGPGQRAFFVSFTLGALLFAMFMFAAWTGPRDSAAHGAIGLLIGGGLGNLYDRLTYACVRDFIHPLPGWLWPGGITINGTREIWPYVSNLADLFLLVGIVILLRHLWRRDGGRGGQQAGA